MIRINVGKKQVRRAFAENFLAGFLMIFIWLIWSGAKAFEKRGGLK
jgi:hypothetical protein